jgi:glycosyl hydrolase family 26
VETVAAFAIATALSGSVAEPAGAESGPPVAFGAFTPGAPQERPAMDAFTKKVGRRPAIWLTYRMWGETPVPRDVVETADANGGVVMFTWHPQEAGLRNIARGDHDGYLRNSARDAAGWGKPVMIRFGAEMNGGWFPWGLGVDGNSADDFKSAWRHIVRVFRQEGANNVLWVWSPNVGTFNSLYPGDEYVDWLALDGYNWGTAHGDDEWQSFEEIYSSSYNAITHLSKRPLMIGEFGANQHGGDKAAWIRDTFSRATLDRFPRIRAYVWFNTEQDGADWRVDSSSASLSAFRAAIGQSLFDLDTKGFLASGDDGSAPPAAVPELPAGGDAADTNQDPTGGGSDDGGNSSARLKCGLFPGRSLRMNSAWDVTVPVRCARGSSVRCMGLVKVKDVRTHRTLGVSKFELWAGRRQPIQIGLPGWARSSLRSSARRQARLTLKAGSGCRGGAARRVTLIR